MQPEDLNPLPGEPQSEQLVRSLADITLDAVCTRRDELMYLCGQASASAQNRRASSCRWSSGSGWLSVAAVVLAFISGGLAGRAFPDTSQLANQTQLKAPREEPARRESLPDPSINALSLAARQSTHARPGERLYAAMQPVEVDAVLNRQAPSLPGRGGTPLKAMKTLRAASIDRILREDSI